jgi:hypothetical protein
MKKMFILFAATSLIASSVAFAEDMNNAQPTNSHDVLQTVPNQGNNDQLTVADASSTAAPADAMTSTDASMKPAMDNMADKPAMVKHHVKKKMKCTHCRHPKKHAKKMHHAKKHAKSMVAPAPMNDATATPAPAAQ